MLQTEHRSHFVKSVSIGPQAMVRTIRLSYFSRAWHFYRRICRRVWWAMSVDISWEVN